MFDFNSILLPSALKYRFDRVAGPTICSDVSSKA